MAFKLTKDEEAQRGELVTKLQDAAEALDNAVMAFNEQLEALRMNLIIAEHTYNSVVGEAREFVEDIAGRADSEYSEKSERWQEGEKGQAAQEWQEQWSSAASDFADLDIEYPEDITVEVEDADRLENLDEEAAS